MAENADLAGVLRNIADLLDVQGERFKPEAYRRAARSIEALPEPITAIASRGGLSEIPGVGEAISEKIREYLKTGQIAYHERLRREIPPGVVEILQLPGLGPKTARRFWVELGIEGPQELLEAIRQGRLDGLKGFGPRKIELIRAAVEGARSQAKRTPLREAFLVAQGLVRALESAGGAEQVIVAGSLRRCRETVGDLDVLVTSNAPEKVFDRFSALPEVARVVMRGPTKETAILSSGIQVDVRVVAPDAFGAALVYFTGSKDHNIHLRSMARDRGLKVNEYGIFRGDERVAGTTEEEVYATFGLPWIPAEIREDHGEFAAAEKRELPILVNASDLKGFLHHHLEGPARTDALTAILTDARRRGHGYVGLVIPGSSEDLGSVRSGFERAARAAGLEPDRILLGVEWPLACAAPVEKLPMEVDYWVGRMDGFVPSARPKGEPAGVPPLFVGHLNLAGSADEVPDAQRRSWVEWARREGSALEVTPAGPSDGLDSAAVRRAIETDVDLVISPGTSPSPEVDLLSIAVGLARRGWATAARVVNARDLRALPRRRPRGSTPRG